MPAPESEAVRVLRQFRVSMDALDESVVNDLASRWLSIELSLEKDMMILAQEFERRTAAGETVTEQMIFKSRHYEVLQSQVQKEVLKYNRDFAVDAISSSQERAAVLGINAAQQSIYASYPTPLSANFDKLNVGAVESLIGFAGDGTPLKKLLDKAVGDASEGIVSAMLAGLGKGDGAFAIAKQMADGMGLGLDRSLLIARTETNRAYRSGSVQQYRESGVVTGFYRLVKKDGSCLACLALDGEFLELESELDDHPNGRCSCIPAVRGMDAPEWERGPDWLENQTEEKQREVMGNTRFEMWKNGTPLDAFVTHSHSDAWGDAPQVRSIKDLLEGGAVSGLSNTTMFAPASDISSALRGELTEAQVQERMDAVLMQAKEQKVPAGKIVFSDKDHTDELIGDVAANYSQATRKVTFFPAGVQDADFMGTAIHEFAHYKIDNNTKYKSLGLRQPQDVLINSWKMISNKPISGVNVRGYGEISEYTTTITEIFGAGKNKDIRLMLDEVFAELSRLNVNKDEWDKLPEFWKKYYKEVKDSI